MARFKHLLSPMTIGTVTWKNRMFKTGAGSAMMIDNGGHVTEVGKQYYWSFARGGIGCVFVECPNIDEPLGHRISGDFRVDEEGPGAHGCEGVGVAVQFSECFVTGIVL